MHDCRTDQQRGCVAYAHRRLDVQARCAGSSTRQHSTFSAPSTEQAPMALVSVPVSPMRSAYLRETTEPDFALCLKSAQWRSLGDWHSRRADRHAPIKAQVGAAEVCHRGTRIRKEGGAPASTESVRHVQRTKRTQKPTHAHTFAHLRARTCTHVFCAFCDGRIEAVRCCHSFLRGLL